MRTCGPCRLPRGAARRTVPVRTLREPAVGGPRPRAGLSGPSGSCRSRRKQANSLRVMTSGSPMRTAGDTAATPSPGLPMISGSMVTSATAAGPPPARTVAAACPRPPAGRPRRLRRPGEQGIGAQRGEQRTRVAVGQRRDPGRHVAEELAEQPGQAEADHRPDQGIRMDAQHAAAGVPGPPGTAIAGGLGVRDLDAVVAEQCGGITGRQPTGAAPDTSSRAAFRSMPGG